MSWPIKVDLTFLGASIVVVVVVVDQRGDESGEVERSDRRESRYCGKILDETRRYDSVEISLARRRLPVQRYKQRKKPRKIVQREISYTRILGALRDP